MTDNQESSNTAQLAVGGLVPEETDPAGSPPSTTERGREEGEACPSASGQAEGQGAKPYGLVAATEKQDLGRIRELLESGVDVNVMEHPSVGQKLNGGSVEVLERLDPEELYALKISFTKAAAVVHYEGVSIGPLVFDETDLTRTALQTAADLGHKDIVDLLLEQKEIDVNFEPYWEYGRTAYQAAVESGHDQIAAKILEHGAEITANWAQCPPTLLKKILELNKHHPESVESLELELYNQLSIDLGNREYSRFCSLLSYVDDVKKTMSRNQNELTAALLHVAATVHEPEMALAWLQILARPKVVEIAMECSDFDGWTPLFVAVSCCDLPLVVRFLEHNVRLNHKDVTGKTALQLALEAYKETIENSAAREALRKIAAALLKAGASTKSLETAIFTNYLLDIDVDKQSEETEIVQIQEPSALWKVDTVECLSDLKSTYIQRLAAPNYELVNVMHPDERGWLAPALVFKNFLEGPAALPNAGTNSERETSFANPNRFLSNLSIEETHALIAPKKGSGAEIGWYSLLVNDTNKWEMENDHMERYRHLDMHYWVRKRVESTWKNGIPTIQQVLREAGSLTMVVTHLYFRFPVVSSELDKLAQDDDDHIELAWLMRTRQKKLSAPVSGAYQSSNKTKKKLSPSSTEEANNALLRSFHFRVDSNTPIHEKLKIPDHGAEFVGYFIVSLHTRWTELTNYAGETLLSLNKRQLNGRGTDEKVLECLLIASSLWIDLDKIFKDHHTKLRELVDKMTKDEVLREDLREDSDDRTMRSKSGAVKNDQSASGKTSKDDTATPVANISEVQRPGILPRKKVYRDKDEKQLKEQLSTFIETTEANLKNLQTRTVLLIDREFNLVSIKEARDSTKLSNSMKRLSWITFIFLPPMFVSGLFGMNVNTLENNPSIGYFFAVCGPTIALVIVVWWLVKNKKLQASTWVPELCMFFKTLWNKSRKRPTGEPIVIGALGLDKKPPVEAAPRNEENSPRQSVLREGSPEGGINTERPAPANEKVTTQAGAAPSRKSLRERLTSYLWPSTQFQTNPSSIV